MSKLQSGPEMNSPVAEIHETLQHSHEELKPYIAHIDHPLLQKTVLQVEDDLDRLQIPYGKNHLDYSQFTFYQTLWLCCTLPSQP